MNPDASKNQRTPFRVGWIIADQLSRSAFCRSAYLTSGGVGLVRYLWLATYVNAHGAFGLRHEIYRPWKRYDALIFLKSMGQESMRLLYQKRKRGWPVIFDTNVNYYERGGMEHYSGMLPSEQQQQDAIEITRAADSIIADSEFLASICVKYNPNVCWLPDSVRMDLVPDCGDWGFDGCKLPLLWSGEAVKLFELLAIEDVLLKYASRIKLILVTNSLSAMDRWRPGYRERLEAMLKRISHQIIPYQGILHLFDVYSRGGVFISPRFLDNTYNLGHTEWKITLAMACGRMVLCSPVPSYVTVARRAQNKGIRICETSLQWESWLEALLSRQIMLQEEERAARKVVEDYYETSVIARQHSTFVRRVIEERHPTS